MDTMVMTPPLKDIPPQTRARIAGVFYLLTFVFGIASFLITNGKTQANAFAGVCYVGVTILFYGLFKAVSRGISQLAAILSLLGCTSGFLQDFHLAKLPVNSLAFFGGYCLLIGYLIYRSTFLPRVLGVLMAIGGLGWLTFLSPSLSRALSPGIMLPGIIGEGALTIWLLARGVDSGRWLHSDGKSRASSGSLPDR